MNELGVFDLHHRPPEPRGVCAVMRNIVIVGAAITGLAITWSSQAHATLYDPATAFEAGFNGGSNPNGVWSYGYSSSFTSAVTLYDSTGSYSYGSGNDIQYWISSAYNCCIASPAVAYNDGPAFDNGNVTQAANQIDLVASVSQELSTDLLFTAPSAGQYSLTTSFIGDQYGIGVNVAVVSNGSVIFQSTVTSVNQVVPFDTSLNLNKGDVLEFDVLQGDGNQNTGLDLSISSSAPEPAAWAMMLLGFGGLGLAARRSRPQRRAAAAIC